MDKGRKNLSFNYDPIPDDFSSHSSNHSASSTKRGAEPHSETPTATYENKQCYVEEKPEKEQNYKGLIDFFATAGLFMLAVPVFRLVDLSNPIISPNSKVIKMALMFSVVEIPIAVMLSYIIHTRSPKANKCNKALFILVLSAFFFGVSVFYNTLLVRYLNESLDRSAEKVHYTKITDTRIKVEKRRRKGRARTYTPRPRTDHYIEFLSWLPGGTIRLEVMSSNFYGCDVGDIVKMTSKKGFFGLEYLIDEKSYIKYDGKLPDSFINFPVTEEEFNNLITGEPYEK